MAIVRLYKNILYSKFDTINVEAGETVESVIAENTDEDTYRDTLCECYDASTGETFFAPLQDESNKTSVMIKVNGKDEINAGYEIKENDDITVVVTPSSSVTSWIKGGQQGDDWNWWGALLGNITGSVSGGLAGLKIGSALYPGIGSLIGLAIGGAIGGTVGFITGGIGVGQAVTKAKAKANTGSYGESNSLPDVSGSKNTGILGSPYPMVIGKHLVNPFVYGSPITSYSGDNGATVYIKELLCVGYAPLKLTDFTIDQLMAAHNQPWTGNESLKTVMHGMITGVDSGDTDTGEILKKWSNNDIKIEILQHDQNSSTVDYGTIYNESVIQKSIGATPLFVADSALTDLTKTVSYHGLSIGKLRNNSIRFSEQDPYEITVDIDFASGCYSSHTSGNNTIYDSMPCWVAIQWRVYDETKDDTSGDESGEDDGWHSFASINGKIYSKTYTSALCNADLEAHKGNSFSHSSESTALTGAEIASAIEAGYLSSSTVENIDEHGYKTGTVSTSYTSNVSFIIASSTTTPMWNKYSGVNDNWIGAQLFNIEDLVKIINSDNSKSCGTTTMVHDEFRCTTSVNLKDYIDSYKNGNYAGFLLNENNTTKSVQVRVIRVSPCYINQTSSTGYSYEDSFTWKYLTTKIFDEDSAIASDWSENIPTLSSTNRYLWIYNKLLGIFSSSWQKSYVSEAARKIYDYNDHGTVSSIESYLNATSNSTDSMDVSSSGWVKSTDSSISSFAGKYIWEYNKITCSDGTVVNTTPVRLSYAYALSGCTDYYVCSSATTGINTQHTGTMECVKPVIESDMKRLCFIAVQAKADTTQNIINQMAKISCIAESLSPTYDDTNKRWIPESVSSVKKYYSPINSSGTRTEISKSEYETYRQNGEEALCTNYGNDFLTQVSKDIFCTSNLNKLTYDSVTYTRYVLDNMTEMKYVSNNPASCVALACFGAHLGIDAFGYDKVNMMALGQLSVDCESISDGSTYSKKMKESVTKFSYTACDSSATADGTSKYYSSTSDITGTVLASGTSLSGYYSITKTVSSITHYAGDSVAIRFACNAYVYDSMKLEDMITNILVTARAGFSIDNKQRLYVVQDKEVDYAVGIINQQNCLSGSNSISYEDTPSGLQISFSDENDGYDTNYIYCMADGEDELNPRRQIEQYTIKWVTNPVQLHSIGRFVLAVRLLSRETLTRKIGCEGNSIGYGCVVNVADDTLLIGENNGGRITQVIEDSDYIYGLMIDECYDYNGTVDSSGLCTQGVQIIQPSQIKESRCVTIRMATVSGIEYNGSTLYPTVGKTNRILFNKKLSRTGKTIDGSLAYTYLPEIGDIVAIGEVGVITSPYRVKSITPEVGGKFTYTLIPYSKDLYNYGAKLPSFQSHMTIPDRSADDSYDIGDSVSSTQVQKQLADQGITNLGDLDTAPSNPSKGWVYHNTSDGNTYYYDGTAWIIWAQKGDTGDTAVRYSISVSSPVVLISSSDGISPSTLTVTSTKQTGSTGTPSAYAGRFVIFTQSKDDSSYTQVYKSSSNESSYTYTIPSSNIKAVKFSLYGAGDSGSYIDGEEIQVVSSSDGYTVVTENDNMTFSTMYSGYLYEQTQKAVFHVYKGTDEVPFRIESITGVSGLNISSSENTVIVTANTGTTLSDSGTISIKIRVNTGDYYYLGDDDYVLGDDSYTLGDIDDSASDPELTTSISWVKIATSKYFIAHYSIDGATWHSEYLSTDRFMQTSTDSGISWSDVIALGETSTAYSLSLSLGSSYSSIQRDRSGVITPSSVTVTAIKDGGVYTGDIDVLYSTDGSTYTSIAKRSGVDSSTVTVPSHSVSLKAVLYSTGGSDALASNIWTISLGGIDVSYLGLGVLASTTSATFTGTTVDDSGNISSSTYSVTAINGDWMLGYDSTAKTASVYIWDGSSWTATTEQKYVSVAAFDILNLTTAGYTISNYTVIMNAIIKNLMAQNLKILSGGKIYSGSGNYGNSDTPIFLGYDGTTAKMSLGTKLQFDGTDLTINGKVNATSGNFKGNIKSSYSIFKSDLYMPAVEFVQTYDANSNVTVDMINETASAIKTKLDNILSNGIAIRIDYEEDTSKMIYIYCVSNDDSNESVTTYRKGTWFLQKILYHNSADTSTYNHTRYYIGSVSGSDSRILIDVSSDGTITKYTSSSLSNVLLFSYYSKEFDVNSNLSYFGGNIRSRLGYKFSEIAPRMNQSYQSYNTGDYYYKCLSMMGVGTKPTLCCVEVGYTSYAIGCVYLSYSDRNVYYLSAHLSGLTASSGMSPVTTSGGDLYSFTSGSTTSSNITNIYL